MNKKLTTLGCMLVLAALAMPGVIAHNTDGLLHDAGTGFEKNDAWARVDLGNPGASTVTLPVMDPDHPCDGIAPQTSSIRLCFTNDGVSGNYVGPAGPYLHVVNSTSNGPLPTLLFAAGAALCDAEVLGPGANGNATLPDQDGLNEADVDGAGGGQVPDGVWDDGGHGAACHTPSTHYAHQPFNTPGCGEYDLARAEDVVIGSEVWIGTSCDFLSPVNGTGIVTEFSLCATNNVLTQNVPGLVACVNEFAACLTGAPPGACPTGPGGVECGGDSGGDAGFFGEGSGHVGSDHMYRQANNDQDGATGRAAWDLPPNDYYDVPFAEATNGNLDCRTDTTISEAVFTWAAATVEVTDTEVILHNLSVPTYGWIDSTNIDDETHEVPPPFNTTSG